MNVLQESSAPNTPSGARNSPERRQGVENQQPAAEEGADDLILGETLPQISAHSNLNYRLTGLRNAKVIHTCAAVPPELRTLDSALWKNGAFLQNTFKKPSKRVGRNNERLWKKCEQVFPPCLLLGATTLRDRLIVVNWWISLDKDAMTEHKSKFSEVFSRPTVSASPLGHRTSAAAAARAEQQGVPFKLTTILDDVAMKQKHLESTSSKRTLNNRSIYRKQEDPPLTDKQVWDRTSREVQENLQKYTARFLSATKPPDDISLSAKVEFVTAIRVTRPGGGENGADRIDTFVYGRNENEVKGLLGGEQNMNSLVEGSTRSVTWYHDSG